MKGTKMDLHRDGMWEISHRVLIYHDDDLGEIVFKRKTKKEKMKRKIVSETCEKIDKGVKSLHRLVLLKNTLNYLDNRLSSYPDVFYLKLTKQKHPYIHLF